MEQGNMMRFGIAWAAVICVAQIATAQLTEFNWTGGVNSNWHQNGNWDMNGFPNAGNHAASIATGSNLTVDLAASDATIAALTLDGTSPGTAIEIASTGSGILILQNDEDNTFIDDPDPEIAPVLDQVGVNDGRVLVTSSGAEGSTNEISAPVRVNNSGFLEGVDFIGTRSITLSGGLDMTGVESEENPFATFAQLRSLLPAGEKVLITGDVSLVDPVALDNPARSLALNSYGTTDHGVVDDGEFPDDDRSPPRGTIEITGTISGTGGLNTGWEWFPAGEQQDHDPAPPPGLPLGTVILSGDNTFTGNVGISRGNLVVRHNNALGIGGTVTQVGHSGNSKEVGYNFVADAGDLTIANPLAIVQWQTFKGDSSVTWQGMVFQNGARGLINLMVYDLADDTGATLTFTGPLFASREAENPPEPGRILTFDGTGKTVVTGGIHDMLEDDPEQELSRAGSLRKRGTGTLVIGFEANGGGDTPTDYSGDTYVDGGNLHFVAEQDLPSPGNWGDDPAEILSSGGAIGVDAGVLGESDLLLGMLNNSSNPNHSPATSPPFFRTYQPNNAIFTRYDHGGLMLGSEEYDDDLDFNSGDLANAANMTLAAWETGSTYTGSITPSTAVIMNPNTYQLGGGSGTLTLPSNNQLTGERDLLVTNGGEVRLEGVNDYSGSTTVMGKYHSSLQEHAAADTADPDHDGDYAETSLRIYVGTTLTVTSLGDGNSSIGTSTDGEDLVVQGSTLKYVGGAVSTNRLLTLGTAGGTIDASGNGPLNFANTGPLLVDVAEDREAIAAVITGTENRHLFGIPSFNGDDGPVVFDTSDLVAGMTVSVATDDESGSDPFGPDGDDLVVTTVLAPNVASVGEEEIEEGEEAWTGFATTYPHVRYNFGPAPARTLTLTGENAGDNTLSPQIADAADRDEEGGGGGPGGKGSVGVTKNGSGKWLLANENNTYTGDTVVEEGTLGGLSIGTGDLTVEDGGTIAPGLSTHTLTVGGDYQQDAGGTFEIEINGTTAGLFDALAIDGDAVLEDGALLDVVLGTSLSTGTTFDVLTASSVTANLGMISLIGASGFAASIVGGGTILQLEFTGGGGVLGDYNGDGVVNAADYVVWRNVLANGGSLMNESASPGVVDQDDYEFWVSRFGATSGSGAGTAAVIPEPSAAVLLGWTLAALVGAARTVRRS